MKKIASFALMVVIATLKVSTEDTSVGSNVGNNDRQPGDPGSNRETTYDLQTTDENTVQQVATLLKTLESLGVLPSSEDHCLSVEKIVKTETVSESSWRIGVNLYVSELSYGLGRPATAQGGQTTNGTTMPTKDACQILKAAQLPVDADVEFSTLDGVNASANGTRPGGAPLVTPQSSDSGDNPHPPTQPPPRRSTNFEEILAGARLSKTQVLVISTCSVVFGLFFIMAISMRIRSYVKRVRMAQELESRPTFRSCSVALRNNQNDSRANSITVKGNAKTSSQQKLEREKSVKGDGGSGDGDPLSAPESSPFLVVTSASAPASPSLSRSDTAQPRSQEDKDSDDGVTNSVMPDVIQRPPIIKPKLIVEDADAIYQPLPPDDTSIADNAGYSLLHSGHFPSSQERLLDFAEGEENTPAHSWEASAETPDVKATSNQPCVLSGTVPETKKDVIVLLGEAGTSDTGHQSDVEVDIPVVIETDNHSLAETGLTQSDSSISSDNPSYRYGNQVEYTGTNSYGNVPYHGQTPSVTVTAPQVKQPVSFQNPVYENVIDLPLDGAQVEIDRGDYVNENFESDEQGAVASLPADGARVVRPCNTNAGSHIEIQINDESLPTLNDSEGLGEIAPSIHGVTNQRQGANAPLIAHNNDPSLPVEDAVSDNEDDEEGDNANTNLLYKESSQKGASSRDKLRVCDERSFLLGPEFEGIEPTYV